MRCAILGVSALKTKDYSLQVTKTQSFGIRFFNLCAFASLRQVSGHAFRDYQIPAGRFAAL
jgi:hypothetical protein